MACKNICRLCDHLVISTAVTFTAPNLIVTIPAGSYNDNEKYCLVIAQAIPATATIDAPVFVQIGTGTELYPVQRCDCTPLTACGIRTRTKYCTKVETTATGGVFKLLGRTCCQPNNNLRSINGTAPAPTGGEPAVANTRIKQ